MNRIFTLLLLLVLSCRYTLQQACGAAQQTISCYPDITSLSYEREIISTSTCGIDGPIQYSVREASDTVDCCQTCDSRFEYLSHPNSYLTDLHVFTNITTWISETGIYSPDTVNLTLSLPNKAELDTLSFVFASFKPHSFYLERSRDGGITYDVMRYFSVDCVDKYQLDPGEAVLTDDQIVCEEITSNRPGLVLYIPDQTRPIGDESDPIESDTLTEFITFTHLRLVLDGHRIYSVPPPDSPERDMSYYYEIEDLSVSGRCACNGHSTDCDVTSLACVCEHNTQGTSCEECAPLYQDLPWRRGTPSYPFQCKLCECNSHSTSCYFDPTLYAESNNTSGGVCIDCIHNTTGVNCESCVDPLYLNPDSSLSSEDVCLECGCNSIGVINDGVCNTTTGQCECKDNVMGRTCDTCKAGYFNLSADNLLGCSPCNCYLFGSITASCDNLTGQCDCRDNVQSQACNQCKPGYYNIMSGTMDGCLECDCDVGGSSSPICNTTTGDCICREGVTGRQCNARSEGYFVPLIDFLTLEGEEGNGTFSPLLLTTGVNEDFTGTGYASLMPSNTLTFQSSISVTTSGIYQLVIRYTLRSTASQSLNFRFDVDNSIQTDGACAQQILTPTVMSISGFIPGSTKHTSVDVCLNSNIEYTLTLSHPGTQSTVLIDSLVVIPLSTLPALAVFNTSSSLLENYTRECVEPRLQLDTWDDINMRFCNPITLSLSAELYNGLQLCDCVTDGSTADNCTFGGQCSCVSGVGGDRTCSQCLPGYHSFTEGDGCSVCGCVVSGSASGVCDFASGQCDCLSLVDGDKCDMCETGAYNFTSGMGCSSCDCDILGSSNFQCLAGGECICRAGVEGEKCEMCRDGYFGLGINGCESCNCDSKGVVVDSSSCDADTGECQCKTNVEGRECGQCKEGYFNLDVDNPTGCRACYCNGRSDAVCSAAVGYVEDKVTTLFNANASNIPDGWVTLNSNGEVFNGYFPHIINNLPSIVLYEEVEYIKSPAKFLNFKLSSYTQPIQIQLTISTAPQIGSTFTCPPYTLVLRGSSFELGTCAQLDITDSTGLVSLSVLLHESAGWVRTDTGSGVTEFEFLQVLSNLTALLIRGNYFSSTNAYFHEVSLPTAVRSISDTPVNWVESCACQSNYTGPSCSRCAPGYYRQPDGSCIRCNCFGDFSQLSCDSNTGECIVCPPSTTGGSCESCIGGYYGSPSEGIDCEPCSCPGKGDNGSFSPLCELIPTEFLPADTPRGLDIECTACTQGHTGMRCEFCEDNYYGDPISAISCQLCVCNGNIDLSIAGNCDNTTGICLKCINNTSEDNCGVCVAGYYGDAILAKNCTECDCDPQGAHNQECNTENGQCECRENTGGRRCDMCLSGYFDISSGTGCRDCACSPIGTPSNECNVTTGQCECLPGVTGLKCDVCQQDYYGFSSTGCFPCNCFEPGSIMSQCDSEGRCSCKERVFGVKCDKCAENFYDVTQGCIACPECYQELQESINVSRREIENASIIIDGIDSNRKNVSFTTRLDEATNLTYALVDETERLKDMELSNIELTHQLIYTVDFLTRFITEISASIEVVKNKISFVNQRAMVAVSLTNTTRMNLVEISDYLKGENRSYINQTKELMDIFERMEDIATEMNTIANQHKLQADDVEMLIEEASNLSTQASYTIMRTYQLLISVVTPSIHNLTALLYPIIPRCDLVSSWSMDELKTAVEQLSQSYSLISEARTPNTNDGFNTSVIQSDLERFQQYISEISIHSNELKYNITSLIEKIKIIFDNLTQYSSQIDGLISDGNYRENATKFYNESITARDLGNSLVETLKETNVTISNFNKTTTEVQNDTRESLKKVEQILEMSKQAEMNASQVLKKFSSAARVANETYTNSILAGDIATNASDKLVIFRQNLSKISQELSEYTISFNTTLRIVQGYANTADIQDNIMNELRNESRREASFCINKAREIGDLAENTTYEIEGLLEEIRIAIEQLQPPVFDILEFEDSFNLLNVTITNAQLGETVKMLKERLADQRKMKSSYASQLSNLKKDLSELRMLESSLPKSCNTGV